MDQPLKHVFATAINAIEAAAAIAASNAERATSDAERHAAFAKDAVEKIKAASKATEELPSAVLETSSSCEDTCDICDYLPPWREVDKERGICSICAEHLHDGPKYYTEEFAHASAEGKDALRLLIVRQRADNCRDTIAAAAGSYDGDLELHEACVEETFLNKRAAECLGRLPASFAPWWKDTWSHEKWCEMASAREAAGWPVKKSALIAERLAAMFLTQQHKACELKKAHAEQLQVVEERLNGEMEVIMKHKLKEMEAKHAEVLAKIERARKEDLAAVEARYKREMAEKDKRYREALDPLLGVRDTVRAECEKKCHDANRKGYAMGYAFADQKWNPVYKAVCEELELVRKEGANHQAGYIRLVKERDELILAQVDLRQELDESAEANEKLEAQAEELREELAAAQKELSGWAERYVAMNAENKEMELAALILSKKLADETASSKALRENAEEDKQMVQRHLKEVAKENAKMTAWEKEEIERLREENKTLQKKQEALLELVDPTIKLMKSNPELFGGEARGGAPAPAEARGSSSPRPPPIIRLKEEVKGRALNFLRSMLAPSRPCLLVESSSTVLPGIVEAEPSTEGMCMALTEEQYKEMFGADLPPPIVPDQDKVCGTAGCIECPPAEPVAVTEPEPVAEPVAAQKPTPVCCVDCGKPKPNYNHPNWPSPLTKRFAKHLAKHSGLRSPWQSHDPKTIKTHEDALEYIAKRVNISVETLLGCTMKDYQSTYDPWTLVKGPNNFHMGTAPATWWC